MEAARGRGDVRHAAALKLVLRDFLAHHAATPQAGDCAQRSIAPPHTPRAAQRALERLSPFELKDRLIALAADHARASASQMLNAGRGNPNWLATTPREAFFTLGRFALEESRHAWEERDLGGMARKGGIARRLEAFLQGQAGDGARLLQGALDYGVASHGFDPDEWAHELADAVLGDQYPYPVRMLPGIEAIVHDYLAKALCGGESPPGRYDLFATEGATAAVGYVFDALVDNSLLKRGDRVALAVPIFCPYLEIPRLGRYGFDVVEICASERRPDGTHAWQYPDAQIARLADRSIKALFVVNPSNPPSVAIRPASMNRLVEVVRSSNPDLMIVTDDVYATFVPGFRSLLAALPRNTIGIYSFSKYFGCTGWRLGVVAIHEDNVFDRRIAALARNERRRADARYAKLTVAPERMKFIDRMVADSRRVALNHTAGLSTPQQVQMALFALFALLDQDDRYQSLTRDIVRRRLEALWAGLGLTLPDDPDRAGYYCELDLMVWAETHYGAAFAKFLKDNHEPVDLVFRLAEHSSIVLLPGGGFGAPEWSLRVSLANLPEEAYGQIGENLRRAAQSYHEEWLASQARAAQHS
ncbi:MAG: aspartate 4-decarboxylase [Betaproteobacteria bacterium]|nr:aspartate 4-decarboxylase [Betaproteobacteria bacterium]